MPPERSVRAHLDLRTNRMLPVHPSPFDLAFHHWDKAIRRTAAEAWLTGVELAGPRVGEWVDAGRKFVSPAWWENVR